MEDGGGRVVGTLKQRDLVGGKVVEAIAASVPPRGVQHPRRPPKHRRCEAVLAQEGWGVR